MEIANRIERLLQEKADMGMIGMGRKKKSGSKTAKRKTCTVSRSCKRIKRGKGQVVFDDFDDESDYESDYEGAGPYAAGRRACDKKAAPKKKKAMKKKAVKKVAKKKVAKKMVVKRAVKKKAVAKKRKPNKWIIFVKKYWSKHPSMSYREVIMSPKVKQLYYKQA